MRGKHLHFSHPEAKSSGLHNIVFAAGPSNQAVCLSLVLPLAVIRRYTSATCAQKIQCVNLCSQTHMKDEVISADICLILDNLCYDMLCYVM